MAMMRREAQTKTTSRADLGENVMSNKIKTEKHLVSSVDQPNEHEHPCCVTMSPILWATLSLGKNVFIHSWGLKVHSSKKLLSPSAPSG